MITSTTTLHNGAFNLLVSVNGYPKISVIGIPTIGELIELRNKAANFLWNMGTLLFINMLCMN